MALKIYHYGSISVKLVLCLLPCNDINISLSNCHYGYCSVKLSIWQGHCKATPFAICLSGYHYGYGSDLLSLWQWLCKAITMALAPQHYQAVYMGHRTI